MTFSNLTDTELLRRLNVTKSMTLLEVELMFRLERALDEVDELTREAAKKPKSLNRRASDKQGALRLVTHTGT